MSCKMYIKSVNGWHRTVCVNSEEELKNMTLKEFVRRFCPEEEEDLDIYRYIFESKLLEGDHTLGCYGIKHDSTIHTIRRIRGGGDPDGDRGEDGDEDEDEDGDGDEDGDRDRDRDEDEGMSWTESMDRLDDMQQTEPECCIL